MPSPSPALFKALKARSDRWLRSHFRDPYVKQRLSDPANYRSRSAYKLIELHSTHSDFLTRGVKNVVDLGAAPGGWSQVVAGKMGWTEERELQNLYAEGGGSWSDIKVKDDGDQPSSSSDSSSEGSSRKPPPKKRSPYSDFYGQDNTPHRPTEAAQGTGTIVAADLLPISPIPGVRTLQIDFLSPEAGDLIRAMLMSPSNPEGKADLILSDMAANFTGNRVKDVESSLDICLAVLKFAKKNLRTTEETGNKYTGCLL